MGVTFDERPKSYRTSTNPQSVTKGYVATGIFDVGIIRSTAIASVPMLIYSIGAGPLYRTNIVPEEVGNGIWNVDVTWGPFEKKEIEQFDCKWSMSTTGGTKHITQALETIARYLPNNPSPTAGVDHQGAIAVNENQDVEGTEILAPIQEWTENYQLLIGNYGWGYMDTIVTPMTALVNDATFRNKPRGSVLFKGGTGGRSSKDPQYLDLTLNFAYQAPISSPLTIQTVTIPEKEGWFLMDFMYATAKAPPAAPGTTPRWAPQKVLAQVDIKRVYDYGDFSQFGVGTGSLGIE